MNDNIFKRIISDNSNHSFDDSIRLLCITGSNLQWLKMMINNYFSNCESYNPDLLEIKSSEPEEARLGIMGCRYEVMSRIDGIEEIKIYYDDVDITDYFLGSFEDVKTSRPSEGGPLGLSYFGVSLRSEKALELAKDGWKDLEKSEYPDEEGPMVFDDILCSYSDFVGEIIKKNIFTICTFDDSSGDDLIF